MHFSKFGDFSLDFEVVYYVLSGDYNKFMDRQHQVNLGLVEAFDSEHIAFAFPTQTIYVHGEQTAHSVTRTDASGTAGN